MHSNHTYKIRAAQPADLPRILEIYERARAAMRADGNPTQWQGGWPPEDVLKEDIRVGRLFVVCNQEFREPGSPAAQQFCNSAARQPSTPAAQQPGTPPSEQIHGVFAFILGKDPTYSYIEAYSPQSTQAAESQNPQGTQASAQPSTPATHLSAPGAWLNSKPYGVIHRIASDGSQPGILAAALDFAFTKTDNLRIDTHKDNKKMQHLLAKHGFAFCGIIYLESGDPRLAFHKALEPSPIFSSP